jgi:DUF1680 family protein
VILHSDHEEGNVTVRQLHLSKLVVLAVLFMLGAAHLQAAKPAVAKSLFPTTTTVLQPFNYQGVTVEGGRLLDQINEVKAFYLAISNDSLLKGFRTRAGRSAPGTDLGGWYTRDFFNTFGQVLSGLARMYAATGDVACRDKANYLFSEWELCIAGDGYFFHSNAPNAPHYFYEKMGYGLLDIYLYCNNPQALVALERITDWAIANLDRTRVYGYNAASGNTEWYTLGEALDRAYLVTNNTKYRDFSDVWKYEAFWFLFRDDADIFAKMTAENLPYYHAYSHVNSLNGLGSGYLVNQNPDYKTSLIKAYDYLLQNQCFITGGFGPGEKFMLRPDLKNTLKSNTGHFETQCGSWAVFKIAKYLISITGDARFGDWAENMMVNGIGASAPVATDGTVQYFSSYSAGSSFKERINNWSCCTGTRIQAVADYTDQIFYHNTNQLLIAQFIPSSVMWSVSGQNVLVRQTTNFPSDGVINITVQPQSPISLGLLVRKPGWVEGTPQAFLNGSPIALTTNSLNCYVFNRTWNPGDQLQLRLPMTLKYDTFDHDGQVPGVMHEGPVVLAVSGAVTRNPAAMIDGQNVNASLTADPANPHEYTLIADPTRHVKPYYSYGLGERYYMYLNPTLPDYVFSAGWGAAAGMNYTNQTNATITYSFTGTGIRWNGNKFDDGGKGQVMIDGRDYGTVDQYGPGRFLPFTWESGRLPYGTHEITIRNLGQKTPRSLGQYINFTDFDILNDPVIVGVYFNEDFERFSADAQIATMANWNVTLNGFNGSLLYYDPTLFRADSTVVAPSTGGIRSGRVTAIWQHAADTANPASGNFHQSFELFANVWIPDTVTTYTVSYDLKQDVWADAYLNRFNIIAYGADNTAMWNADVRGDSGTIHWTCSSTSAWINAKTEWPITVANWRNITYRVTIGNPGKLEIFVNGVLVGTNANFGPGGKQLIRKIGLLQWLDGPRQGATSGTEQIWIDNLKVTVTGDVPVELSEFQVE